MQYLKKTTSSSTLSIFRLLFGFLMSISLIRFWVKGWINDFYVDPLFHFTYHGFEWVRPLGEWTYLIFIICIISSVCVCVGYKYRMSIIIFFLSFTYIELMDKTHYLNHYYFISVLSFLMIFLPANASFSVDNFISRKTYTLIPKWNIDVIKLLISIVYIYAGIAKINSDWLLYAEPLKTWLLGKYDYSIFSYFFSKNWVHYLFSWFGLFYDLTIPFLLFYHRTRLLGFMLVVVFHVMTKILFPIGMFPYIMIIASIIFFSPLFHDKIINSMNWIIEKVLSYFSFNNYVVKQYHVVDEYDIKFLKPTLFFISLFIVFQLLFPFRYLLYPGDILWHEQGYRYSWRVMLIEKTGLATFKIANSNNKDEFFIFDNHEKYLTTRQIKQMSFQPDFILEYAHFLGETFSDEFNGNISVYCNSEVKLNHRYRQKLVNDTVDLLEQTRSFKHKKWVLPVSDENKNL